MYADSNGIFYLENPDLGGNFITQFNAAQSGTSAALGARQRKTYIWTNQAALEAQIGMSEGSEGYRLDIKSEYRYENGRWRLATPHAEYDLSVTGGDTAGFVPIGSGASSAVDGFSSSDTFVQDLSNGFFRVVDPGIYSFSMVSKITNAQSVGNTELVIARSTNNSYGGIVATGIIAPERQYGSVAVPNIRLTSANNDFGFAISKRTGGDAQIDSRVRITRIG